MKYFSIIAFFLFLSFTELSGQAIQLIDGEGIAVLSSLSDDTTYVLNFWATWCSPCVKEIAIFEKLHKDKTYPNIKVILVSLDFVNQIERRVIPFLEEKGIMKLVKATPEQYDEVSSFKVPKGGEGVYWAHPVVCGGILYIRHADKLFVYDVRGK